MSDEGRLEIGQTFGRYQIVRVLGEGGMGIVYEALHLGLKKRFAVKTLLPSVARLPEARARFLREGEAASRVRHPNVVDVIDVGTEAGIPFLVMEFLDGRSLADLISSRQRMEIPEAVDLLLPALSAVAAGHAQGVVHRDLKPANVFVARGPWTEPVVKVLDFGVSKLIGAGDSAALTATAAVLGTAAYMSPEQAMGLRQVDGRSDQFALGMILYEMLTGARPHPGENQFEVLHNITTGTLVPPRQRRPDLPVALEEILLRMLALAPDARYPTLFPVGRALLPFASKKGRLTLAHAFQEPAATGAVAPRAPSPPAGTPNRISTTFRESAAEIALQGGADPRVQRRAGRRGKLIFSAVAAIGVAATLALTIKYRTPPAPTPALRPALTDKVVVPATEQPPAPRTIDVRVLPAEAEIALDGNPAVRGHLRTALPAGDHAPHVLRMSAPSHRDKQISFGPGTDPPAAIALEPLAPPQTAKRASRPEAHRPPGGHAAGEKRPAPAPHAVTDTSRRASSPVSPTAPAAAHEPAETPKRGANNALIIR